ncbi:hypothetical protein RSOLAG22IIIB_08604 [Rhizoctonia solani]|uniref:Uncharacterized protein n=1 Tax=Rhizoctonia solani TaxID=456999 RepID=A0A0K6FUF1_9AGAM|nr:hypothetical protein RSOLAG22IIIB_08604 [Rhizoctonia solani]
MPEVQALLDFMNMEAVDEDGDPDLTMFFKHECILRALRLLLLGESAIDGKHSSKAQDPHAKLWHLTDVTPLLLAFVATVAEIFADYGVTDAHINRQLALSPEGITLKDAKEYHETLATAIRLSGGKFAHEKIVSQFEGYTFTHYIHFQPVMDALATIVGDPDLFPFMKYYPEECCVYRLDAPNCAMQVWEELWHSLLWWKLQDCILSHQCILYLVIYVDETSVSTIGGVHVWPIYLWVGNLPASIRKRCKGKGGAIPNGYLPKKDKRVRDMAGFRCQVYHDAMAKIFESLKIPSRHGTPLRCGDGVIRNFVPVLAAGSADYMEL